LPSRYALYLAACGNQHGDSAAASAQNGANIALVASRPMNQALFDRYVEQEWACWNILNSTSHVHEVLHRQPMRRDRTAQLRYEPVDLQVYFRNRGNFPPRRARQWSEGEQPG
jgi:hypothetical protein